ncbi:efflux RND transporter periplasmic adaptor subunit [Frischella sp. Ac48]|uniref:Efflux RND transporter periplasmic adaptor subunit n=1 Tax=Frischella japonica TaxID=2741544 RepID=A0ABR7QUV9_9GAMM|nr:MULTISPECIES: efflux RND transporter periplasmic adaptor subunit [Frischella]MBC9130013.1 efflux RND transporter periplasmic adaptor subunit [Frischella japonica]MBX4132996.1 efflux RND transporter periplasmic adaptor subunit [Frischella sp. Ac48]
MKQLNRKWLILFLTVVVAGTLIWFLTKDDGFGPNFISGNGRIEGTEINISTKLAGRIEQIKVQEGEFVQVNQPLVIMQTDTLNAQLNEAKAQLLQAMSNEENAKAQLGLSISDKAAAEAIVNQRESDLDLAIKHLARTEKLYKTGALSVQQYDDDNAKMESAKAALQSAKSQVDSAQASVESAQANIQSAAAAIKVAEANITQIQADIDDSTLVAPVGGRIQYRIAQPGEVLSAGGKVLNLVNLSDIYLTFFLPETVVGKVAIGDEVRIVLDVIPNKSIPAYVSFVASVAQFTPKTVETKDERQKLMFRVKAQIKPELLKCFINQVKTGLPGVAWVKLDSNVAWPQELSDLAACPNQ